jgi:hypothetical protein
MRFGERVSTEVDLGRIRSILVAARVSKQFACASRVDERQTDLMLSPKIANFENRRGQKGANPEWSLAKQTTNKYKAHSRVWHCAARVASTDIELHESGHNRHPAPRECSGMNVAHWQSGSFVAVY